MKRLTIEQMQALAKERNGVCLSKTYGGALSKLRWRCVEGHEWEARPNNVKNGSWCPACLRGTIEEMQVLAKDRGGECLSTKYVNAKTKLRWRCSEGHEWEAVPSSVQRGKWCPRCSQGNSERIVRDICEQLFGTQFPKARPTWLRNARGNLMELDGYCEQLSLAFEYQGQQHYKPLVFFHGDKETLGQRKADDARKRKLCRANGVHVLVIPYTVKLDDVPAYIVAEVNDLRLPVSMRPPDTVKVAQFVLPEQLRAMQVLARAHDGGECLSTGYVNARTALRWRCTEGHEWECTPNTMGKRVKRGTWCTKCPRVTQRHAPDGRHAPVSLG